MKYMNIVVTAKTEIAPNCLRSCSSLALIAWAVTFCACGYLRSSNQIAFDLINENIREPVVLPFGQLTFIRPDAVQFGGRSIDVSKGQVRLENMSWYEELQKDGKVKITNLEDLASGTNFSWGNFAALTQAGTQKRAMVTLTPTATELRCEDATISRYGGKDLICVSSGSGGVEEIVRSEKFEIGTRQYWLLVGSHRFEWSPIALEVTKRWGRRVDEKRKFMAIAVLDPVAKRWSLDIIDFANRDDPFPAQGNFDRVFAQGTRR